MRVANDSIWRYLADTMVHLPMPLFAFLAGYVYAISDIPKGKYTDFFVKKIYRLGVPLLFASTAFWVISLITGTGFAVPFSMAYKVYLFPYAHYWYLQASLLIFLVVAVWDKVDVLKHKASFFWCFVLTLILYGFAHPLPVNIFSISGMIYLFPSFLLGVWIKRYDFQVSIFAKYLVLILCISLLVFSWLGFAGEWGALPFTLEKEGIFSLFIGVSACLSFYWFQPANKLMAFIGQYSYSIYLYHVFFTSPTRMIINKTGLDVPSFLLFAISLMLGVLGPIAAEYLIIRRFTILKFLCLGEREKKKLS